MEAVAEDPVTASNVTGGRPTRVPAADASVRTAGNAKLARKSTDNAERSLPAASLAGESTSTDDAGTGEASVSGPATPDLTVYHWLALASGAIVPRR
ncbi:hypothetical protein DCC79_00280 [bacterium]|nr:hypothetical protein [Chloroflexi bacterium CFX6]RIL12700.1 MAG: hypothetical protein DCC79_00280 [bacterium]